MCFFYILNSELWRALPFFSDLIVCFLLKHLEKIDEESSNQCEIFNISPTSPALPVPCPEVATLSDSFDKRHRCGVSGLHTSPVIPGDAAITITGHWGLRTSHWHMSNSDRKERFNRTLTRCQLLTSVISIVYCFSHSFKNSHDRFAQQGLWETDMN